MRGEKELSPDNNWDYVVFGGVLGDHPPRDRLTVRCRAA